MALLLGLGGWAVARFIRRAGSVGAEPEAGTDDLGENEVVEVLIIEENLAELH